MKRYTPEELAEVLRLHRLWVEGEEGGARADLSCADLSGANLSRSNLSRANLSRTNLCDAVLCGSNLAHANLAHANLDGADLSRTNLYCADLSRASLRGANLSRTNLCDAIGYVPFVEVGPIGSRNDRTRFTPSYENVVCYCDVPRPGGEAVSEAFERWLRSVCFQKPTPEAYDLAKCAWDHMDAKLQAAEEALAADDQASHTIEWKSRAEAAEAEVARLRNQIVTGIYDAASVGITLIKTEEVDRLRARIAELEEALRDALIDCEFSMEPKLHSDLKALLGKVKP